MIKLAALGLGVKEIDGEHVLYLTAMTEGGLAEYAVADYGHRHEFARLLSEATASAVKEMQPPRQKLVTANGGLPDGLRRIKS